jgi:hypothetical protein
MKNDPFRKANTGRGRRKALEAINLRGIRRPRPVIPAPPLSTQTVTTEETSSE